MKKTLLTFFVAMTAGCYTFAQTSQTLICSGKPQDNNISVLSISDSEVKLRINWEGKNGGSTFHPQNLAIQNGTCADCKPLGNIGANRPTELWTVKVSNPGQPVVLGWGTESTKKYCGTETIKPNEAACKNNKGCKLTFNSRKGEFVYVNVDWDTDSGFDANSLVITNGVCTDCPRLGDVARKFPRKATYKIKKSDLGKATTVTWKNVNYCGNQSLTIN